MSFLYMQSYPGSAHGASPYGGLSPINEVPVLVSSPGSGIDSVPQVSSTAHVQDNTGQHLHVSTTGYVQVKSCHNCAPGEVEIGT